MQSRRAERESEKTVGRRARAAGKGKFQNRPGVEVLNTRKRSSQTRPSLVAAVETEGDSGELKTRVYLSPRRRRRLWPRKVEGFLLSVGATDSRDTSKKLAVPEGRPRGVGGAAGGGVAGEQGVSSFNEVPSVRTRRPDGHFADTKTAGPAESGIFDDPVAPCASSLAAGARRWLEQAGFRSSGS